MSKNKQLFITKNDFDAKPHYDKYTKPIPITKNHKKYHNLLKDKSIYIYDPYGIESGFASNLLLNLNKLNYKGDVKIKTLPVSFIEKGTIKEQEKEFLIDLESSLKWILS